MNPMRVLKVFVAVNVTIFVIALSLKLWIGSESSKSTSEHVNVWHVVDGDTVKLDDGRTMRLAGIDCPESDRNAKCRRNGEAGCGQEVLLGREVSGIVSRLVHEGATAQVLTNSKDRYGRALGYVTLTENGADLGEWLIRNGWCLDWSEKYPHPRAELYRAATYTNKGV